MISVKAKAKNEFGNEDNNEKREIGFVVSKSDSSLFIHQGSNGPICILLNVDDLVITGPGLPEINRVKSQLSDAFEMKDLGDLHYFLGIEVIQTPDGILL